MSRPDFTIIFNTNSTLNQREQEAADVSDNRRQNRSDKQNRPRLTIKDTDFFQQRRITKLPEPRKQRRREERNIFEEGRP